MRNQLIVSQNNPFFECNIYANKSALILDWLLQIGFIKKNFTIREVARDRKVSVGLVQKVFKTLSLEGFLTSTGSQTLKKFSFNQPLALLESWKNSYSIIKKCKYWSYQMGINNREKILNILKSSPYRSQLALALHSAAEFYKCKNTNLKTLEFYLLDPKYKSEIEKLFLLEPKEKGYEVLLIEPYYKSLLNLYENYINDLRVSPLLLTFLDLYHFPLRGREQAEFMMDRNPVLKNLLKVN